MIFQRQDWTLFRSLDTLGQRAGVPRDRIGAVAVKELVDNALDAGAQVQFGHLGDNGFWVEDDGPGLEGDPESVASLFSISRPLTSSKLLRLPTRGALGNGLRVVAGAVCATSGELRVRTRGRLLHLAPQFHDGTTRIESCASAPEAGTRIEVVFGPGLKVDLALAELAVSFAGQKRYAGKTSGHWYSLQAFRELVSAAPPSTKLTTLLALFEGGKTVPAGRKRLCDLDDVTVSWIWERLRDAPEIAPAKLGYVGKEAGPWPAYARAATHYEHGGARLPCVVEVWASRTESFGDVKVLVNRTPVVGRVRHRATKNGAKAAGVISGCGLNHYVETGKTVVDAVICIQTPYMAVTNDGKEPNLEPLAETILGVFAKAARVARRLAPGEKRIPGAPRTSKKDAIADALPSAIAKASGGGKYRYSLRQLYYAIRPVVGTDLDYNYFSAVVADIEAANGADLPGIYRDARGQLYHPHTGETIALGTQAVERYRRPTWTFNKVLYIEKGGLVQLLIESGWPERHDCALLTSQGFASKAAKDVLDLLGDGEEEIQFFCIHDADGPGTLIYEALQEATRSRPGRRVKIINLGLEPSEGRRMRLEVEEFERKRGRVPVASYVGVADEEWLQGRRIELNAMPTPVFLEWLSGKFSQHVTVATKVVPDEAVLWAEAEARARAAARRRIVEEVLARAGVDDMVDAALDRLRPALERAVDRDGVATRLDGTAESWRGVVGALVREVEEAPPAESFVDPEAE